jgi:hypothetical protein
MKAIVAGRTAAVLAFPLALAAGALTVNAQDRYVYGPAPQGYVMAYGYGPQPYSHGPRVYGFRSRGYGYGPGGYGYGPGIYGYGPGIYGYGPNYAYSYRYYASPTEPPEFLPTGSEVWWDSMGRSNRSGNPN